MERNIVLKYFETSRFTQMFNDIRNNVLIPVFSRLFLAQNDELKNYSVYIFLMS